MSIEPARKSFEYFPFPEQNSENGVRAKSQIYVNYFIVRLDEKKKKKKVFVIF